MSIFEKFNRSQSEKKRLQIEEDASYLYQICEHKGEIWLTFNNLLAFPCSMLKDEPVEAIKKMRELYIKRQKVWQKQ